MRDLAVRRGGGAGGEGELGDRAAGTDPRGRSRGEAVLPPTVRLAGSGRLGTGRRSLRRGRVLCRRSGSGARRRSNVRTGRMGLRPDRRWREGRASAPLDPPQRPGPGNRGRTTAGRSRAPDATNEIPQGWPFGGSCRSEPPGARPNDRTRTWMFPPIFFRTRGRLPRPPPHLEVARLGQSAARPGHEDLEVGQVQETSAEPECQGRTLEVLGEPHGGLGTSTTGAQRIRGASGDVTAVDAGLGAVILVWDRLPEVARRAVLAVFQAFES